MFAVYRRPNSATALSGRLQHLASAHYREELLASGQASLAVRENGSKRSEITV